MTAAVGKRQAVVAVLLRAGRVLVIRRGPQARRPGYWAPLSGRIEPGESQAAALVREVREEVGLAVTPLAKVWECDTDDGSYQLHWWTAEVGSDEELILDPGEVSDARWVTPHEFTRLELTFAGHHEFFERVLPTLG
ncbi:ADP-ribose pyrophosphatase [Frankia casuarinae]|nr:MULTISPECIES: NUDIX hydrolase [Frankia]ETA03360.1 ADP-ribose pyrophosphatase [Frankia sp. CcI6]EYT93138.1 ADP-ribose pyrophosphatase [Frankia casuarinae]KDA42745.1 ADP-ribose pyrophosphatase [Frankia sp. BMG5.23]KEZ35968.1 ADP-ribose pyrophosphatase [Frankia sp. CeD]KFB04179.1 ADP-ribose pyrophosphatase [Frankia sp. Allo2]